jgi:hypothetical protein
MPQVFNAQTLVSPATTIPKSFKDCNRFCLSCCADFLYMHFLEQYIDFRWCSALQNWHNLGFAFSIARCASRQIAEHHNDPLPTVRRFCVLQKIQFSVLVMVRSP